jgi:hypothetical protein
MANPFTRFINRTNPDKALNPFIDDWDALEALLIDVYRRGETSMDSAHQWAEIRRRLGSSLPAAAGRLAAERPQKLEASAAVFEQILAMDSIDEMVGNRAVLKLLPNAREIINHAVLAGKGKEGD